MEFKGVLDTSIGNFLCIRGFAKLGDLYDVSDFDESFQRNLIKDHKQEVVDFLNDSKFLFFPEVILGAELTDLLDENDAVNALYEKFGLGENFKLKFKNFTVQCSTSKTKKKEDTRVFDFFRRVMVSVPDSVFKGKDTKPFTRIDGNHRISAATAVPHFKDINTPFCIILFRRTSEKSEYSRVIFHNINSKSIPVGLEHSTRLILENNKAYPDETLKESASFGHHYYFARKLYKNIDFDLLGSIQNAFKSITGKEEELASTFLKLFKFLLDEKILTDSENSIRRFKHALTDVNTLYGKSSNLKNSKNDGLLASFLYFQLRQDNDVVIPSFFQWVLSNHITEIDYLNPKDLTKVFDKIIKSKSRKIFISMPFGKPVTENHFRIIARVCNEINAEYKLKIKIQAERVDWFEDGTSYDINERILNMISNCGMLIGNLTYARPNVYHEIGFIMGRDKAIGQINNNFILILDESVQEEADKVVGFNLKSIKQIRFDQTEVLAEKLKENIVKFYGLQQVN
jgi:hypothetical protein